MDTKKSTPGNQSRFSFAKSTQVFLSLLLVLTAACSSKEKSEDIVYFDSLEGEIHQMTKKGENSDVHFSRLDNRLVFVRNYPPEHRTPQIVEKNLITKTESRITHNLGVNRSPRYHPKKSWIVYASSADEIVETLNIKSTMAEVGLNKENNELEIHEPLEIYIEAQDGSKSKRITKEKGFNGIPALSSDGNTLYYLRRDGETNTIFSYNLLTGKKVSFHTEKNLITSLSVSDQFIAWTTRSNDNVETLTVSRLNKKENIFKGLSEFSYSHVELHPTQHRLLVISNLEDKKNKDVYQIDLAENCATRFSFHKSDESSPAFGPEGRSLFFVSNRSKLNQIYSTLIRPELPCKPL